MSGVCRTCTAGAPVDGSAWFDGLGQQDEDKAKYRLLRGGSWYFNPGNCRSAYRTHSQPDNAHYFVGLRVVCLPQGPSLNP